jgi:hypothetical protein
LRQGVNSEVCAFSSAYVPYNYVRSETTFDSQSLCVVADRSRVSRQEKSMRFGAGMLIGIAIGIILVIYLLLRLIF